MGCSSVGGKGLLPCMSNSGITEGFGSSPSLHEFGRGEEQLLFPASPCPTEGWGFWARKCDGMGERGCLSILSNGSLGSFGGTKPALRTWGVDVPRSEVAAELCPPPLTMLARDYSQPRGRDPRASCWDEACEKHPPRLLSHGMLLPILSLMCAAVLVFLWSG